jgi:hypothetical protein
VVEWAGHGIVKPQQLYMGVSVTKMVEIVKLGAENGVANAAVAKKTKVKLAAVAKTTVGQLLSEMTAMLARMARALVEEANVAQRRAGQRRKVQVHLYFIVPKQLCLAVKQTLITS